MDTKSFAAVARIIRTHGLKGEVSVAQTTETSLDALVGLDAWFVPPPAGVRTARITSVRPGPRGTLVKFEEVRGIDDARALVGADILVRMSALPETAAEEPDDDVTGYEVADERYGVLGEVVETIVTGANDVWVVHGPRGEVLIPVIDDVVIEIDDLKHSIEVHLLDGLLPGEAEEA